jgi:hypothetical protein
MEANKKKMILLGVLGVALLGVGVFQFASGGETPPAKPKPAAKKDVPESSPGGIFMEGGLVAQNGGTPADPIKELYARMPLSQRDPFEPNMSVLTSTVTTQQPTPQPTRPTPQPQLPVFDPGGMIPDGPINLEGGPIVPQRTFNYTLSGVILGNKPAAVFTDDAGNQRLVLVGGSLDGDSQVVSVSQGRVVVRHGKKTVNLTLGGNPNEQ